ncbi:glycerol-3-phosphate transporter permease [Rhizobium sp. SEMIA 4085]|uniref:ABC transporter permease subunit n=1 Tax=Rhizobium sp. SEMIA 4085 TaxID=2137761 RepID=UPI0014792736|nr:ABC transporter permease subunit [Rhizobium sp. SEMIA 4085]NNH31437.1 glycerol-3-phosphate transporter permease [Rhizobium sp. SEMIA 4085]
MRGNSPVQVIGGAPRRLRILGRPLSRLATARSPEAGLKAAHFNKPWLAALLVAPQLLILLFFFFIPSYKALSLAFVQVDPFGGLQIFVGLKNFQTLLASPEYRSSALFTLWFTLFQNIATLGLAGLFAFATDFVIRGRAIYKSIILMPYAIAPVISGVLWAFLFNPAVGPIAQFLHSLGIAWDPNRRPFDAQILVTIASIWKNVCYDYIFLVAALLAVPASLLEAAKLDGAGPVRRFFTISLPLVSPTVFFLVVMNFVYGLFETFGIIAAVTRGGPAGATNSLVYKVYQDGFVQLDLGSSAAQSVILMIVAVLFTVLQFRALERKVNYQV